MLLVVLVLGSSSAGPDERPLLRGTTGSTVAATGVGGGLATSDRASLSVEGANVVATDVVGTQRGVAVIGKALTRWFKQYCHTPTGSPKWRSDSQSEHCAPSTTELSENLAHRAFRMLE